MRYQTLFMIKLINTFLDYFITIINLIFNYKVYLILNKIFIQIYSIWISKQFTKIGTNVRFGKKLTLHGSQYICIGNNSKFGYGCILTAWDKYGKQNLSPHISIGQNSFFGEYNHITAINSITIGDGVLTGRWVTITDNAHGKSCYEELCEKPYLRDLYSRGKVVIGNNVWIGDKVSIMPNVKIGESSIIAANSVVTKDIPPFSVAAGIPAIVIKHITPDTV